MIESLVRELAGRRVLVLGLGLEGRSTLACLERWAPSAVVGVADADAGRTEGLESPVPASRRHGGAGYESAIADYEIVVRSPGIRLRLPPDPRVRMTSQTDLFLRHAAATTVAVTGTKGKSTTSALLAHLLRAAGRRVQHLGNIGVPPLDGLAVATAGSIAVLETSSFQAQDLSAAPEVAVLLNVFPEHLDYYGSFEDYVRAKLGLVRHQDTGAVVVSNEDDPVLEVALRDAGARGRRLGFSLVRRVERGAFAVDGTMHACTARGDATICELTELETLRGRHNHANALAAVAACAALDAPMEGIAAALRSFTGLPHRIQRVGVFDGVTYYDDSAASVPEATAAAIEALGRVDTLIVGGLDRGIEMTPIARAVVEHHVVLVILMPETGSAVAQEIAALSHAPDVHPVADMIEAVSTARRTTPPGGVCLLSPGAASYNRYANFTERGRHFQGLLGASESRVIS